ncbi:F-box protein SKIP19-like isoform X1 [Lycium ferocissimum]|uniref:F-box protein SKIP19-like isoform X1 n=1 Tax=Lycium ferocissimum TaxID=112874 RepID=UPI0028149D91|nr:F-box protein SKIP19-like isoform X1 [Lycium ferocissimum]
MVKKPPWLELEENVWANILHKLGAIEILETAQKVCTTWRRICKEPSMWRIINMTNDGDLSDMDYDLEEMCRYAIDRSQGELVDINLEYFATGPLLQYIAQRSGKLKRLSSACYHSMLCDGLVEAVQKLPLLEELSLTHTIITTEGIESLGLSCPLLKSFELNNSLYDYFDNEDARNEEALAIAKNLPALHHLQLIGNSMTNKGLEAILDGCPHLVSLDLRLCIYVSLNEVLSSRISGQIKDVKHPHDSLAGLEFSFTAYGEDDDEDDMSSEDDEDYTSSEEDEDDTSSRMMKMTRHRRMMKLTCLMITDY